MKIYFLCVNKIDEVCFISGNKIFNILHFGSSSHQLPSAFLTDFNENRRSFGF